MGLSKLLLIICEYSVAFGFHYFFRNETPPFILGDPVYFIYMNTSYVKAYVLSNS